MASATSCNRGYIFGTKHYFALAQVLLSSLTFIDLRYSQQDSELSAAYLYVALYTATKQNEPGYLVWQINANPIDTVSLFRLP